MKSYQFLLLASLMFLLFSCGFSTNASKVPTRLGNYPLCEPSAVVKITCPTTEQDCLLVGDNEIDDTLFLYPLTSGKLQADQQQELSLDKVKISDIEAIANLENNRILIVGSHSRNGKCQTQLSRQLWLPVKITNNGLQPLDDVVKTPKIDAQILFEGIDLTSNKVWQAVSQAIDSAEQAANSAEGNQKDCSTTNHFNIEGAVAIGNESSTPNIWLGMRSPLVTLEAKKLAILLHLKNINSYQFDHVALLDLGGRGIRELTLWQNDLWGIAGGPEDDQDNFVLWQFPINLLGADQIIEPKIVRSLPTSSEGLLFVDSTTAYVLLDGDIGVSNSSCLVPGKFLELVIP